MRKVLGSITLLVLLFNTLLTPLTYAEEYEEIIETSSENTAEEVVEENGEEESSSEFSVEEENTDEEKDEENEEKDEENEENTAEEEEEGTEEDEDGEDGEEVEYSTGDNAEDGTGEISEIENGEIEGLTGKTVEGETGDIVEVIRGTTEELTGVVEESIGTGEETIVEEIKYNEEPIIGEETYDNVTVKVEALSGTFPEGTELVIEPIRYWNLVSLKRELVEERNEIGDDTTLVAFDITFRYEGEEVQPKEGEKVKVIFDYTKNEELVEADKDNSQEVKVYHIEDKDEEGNKVEDEEKKIRDVTNVKESEEEGIAVADGKSFSVYAVVATSGNGLRVTYDLNGGYWIEDHSFAPKTVIYTGTETTMFFKTPSNTGYMFMGWYLAGLTTRRNGAVTDGMSVYAKWEPFYDLYTYLLIDQDNIAHKTIMDRNVGATEIYNQNYGKQNAASYGYYFQWGNNYGIGNSSDVAWTNNYTVPSRIWSLGISSKYYSRKLKSNDKQNWMDSTNNSAGLWGGTGDTATTEGDNSTLEGRQGPCPDGYHVPSTVSRQQLFYDWNQIYSYNYNGTDNSPNIDNIRKGIGTTFLIPPTGRYGGSSLGQKGVDISYWSSSEVVNKKDTAHGFYLGKYGIQPDGIGNSAGEGDFKSRARPVRCFKNDNSSYLGNIELKGGTGGIISIASGEVKSLKNPTRNNDTFYGWYTTSDFSGNAIITGSRLQQGDSLYAKWCQDPLVDNGTNCVNAKTITFDTDGGSGIPTQYITPGGTGTRPTDPEKDGYTFVGWYYTGLENEYDFETPVTSDITIYAKWNLIDYHITYNLNGGTGLANTGIYTIETDSFILNNPTKDDYIFEGWSGTNLPECTMGNTLNCEKNVTITQGSTGDRSYEAIWGYIKYDLIFDSIGGSEVESQIVIKGRTGTRPTDPEKDGYTFGGWYYTGLENEFDFEEPIISNITVYAKWNLVDYHITYELNGGTGLTNTGIYTIETDSFTLNNPSKLNYEFIGWSGTNLSGCSVGNQTTCNTTVTVEQGSVGNRVYEAIYDCAYGRKLDGTCNIAKGEDGLIDYENWEYNDLEVDLSVTDPVKIVIMDRNLGAAVSGVEENAFGFYYQWGNNYGFRNVIEKTGTEQVDASAYGPENYYISDTFILQDSLGWDAPVNYNLWGGTGDTTSQRGNGDDEARQGPCPSGYHVPSILEWHKLNSFADTWRNSKNATDVCSEFNDNRQCVLSKFLKIPRAGNILGKDGSFQPYDGGYLGRYWSSSRHNDNRAYRYKINGNWDIFQGLQNNTDNYSYYNSQGMSVRCFKNVSSKPIVYELSGGVQTSNQTSTVVWWNGSAGKTLTIPTKTGFVFEGWYLTSGYEEGTRVTKNVISDYSDNENVTLYAKWKNPEYKTITYNANGGYFSGGLISTGIVFKEDIVSGNYVALTNVQLPNREGYMFDGWYLAGGETEWTGYVNNSTEEQTVYAKWLGFNDLTLTMGGITFTIMDRNLGATDYATGYTYGSDNEQSNQSRRGKYYQWGNNYGFSSSGNPSSNVIISNTDDFGPGNYYSNAVYTWNNKTWGNTHNNLWGGQYSSLGDETRQGPCPVNYHVPTKDEWDKAQSLFNTWKQTEEGISYCNSLVNSGSTYCFSAKLGLPYAGYLEGSSFKSAGTFGTYRSSTQVTKNNPYRIKLDSMNTSTLQNGYGGSVRCFKNTERKALSFESKGGEIISAPTETVRWWESTTSLPTPTRDNSIFSGWYTTSGYVEGSKVAINYIESDKNEITLYAKWECEDGYEEAADGRSCIKIGYTVTYDSITNGGTKEQQTERVEYGDHPILSSYTGYKAGWTFVGWNTNSGATAGLTSNQITVTSDITLYAIYKKEAKTLVINSYSLNGQGITYRGGLNDYSLSCILPEVFNNDEQDTSCNVTMPFVLIQSGSRREFVGINNNSGSTENASNVVREPYDLDVSGFKNPVYSGTITLTEETSGLKWYIISKYPSVTLTGNFHGNGSTISGETLIGCTIDEIYNNASEVTTCALTPPTVTPSTNTPTFLGWNLSSGATANDTTYYNKGTNTLTLALANGVEQDWYAITTAPEVKPKLYIHLNGNDGLAGPAFGSYSHNDVNNLDDEKIIFNLCTIPSSYNGNQQFPYCTQEGTMFTFTPNGTKTAIGWSATSGTGSEIIYTPGQTNVTLTGYKSNPEVHLYAQSVLTGSSYSVIFSGNGAKMGTSESDEITLTCRGEHSYNGEEETKSKECNVKTPSIIREGYIIQGYTGDNSYETEDSNLITGGSSLKLSSINNGNTYYVSSYKPATIIFDKNGNAAQIKSGSVVETIEDVVEICNIWNRKENCRITTPEIIPAVGKAVKGYSTSGTTYENEIAHKALIDVTESRKYYAWSEYSPVKYTANFEVGTGIEPIVETSGSCMTEVKYNSEEIEPSCKVQLPELTAQVGYTNPKWYSGGVEVVMDGERKTTISGDVEFTAKAETHNFTVTITVNDDDYGRVTSGLVEAQEGVGITISGNELTIGDEKVIAIATGDTAQYSYEFSCWNNNCGNVLSGDCTIEVEFERSINTYTVTYDAASHSGTINNQPTSGQEVAYNSTITLPTTGIRSEKGYQFIGWTTTLGGKEPISDTYTVTSDVIFYPIFKKEKVEKNITFHVNNNSGYIYSGDTYTIDRAFSGCNIPTLYNIDPYIGSCEAHITLADIIADNNTPIVLGWSTGENERTISYSVGAEVTITIPEDKNVELYAQTKSEEKRYTATYVTDNRVEENITESAYCDIAETYNGEAQGEECPTPIILPILTAKVGYHSPIWKLGAVEYAGGAQIALSGNVNLTGTATPDEQTPYVVKHYYQTLTNTNEYQLSGEDNLSGETESLLTLSQLQKEASSIPGFIYRQARVNGEVATIIDVTDIHDFDTQAEIQSGLVIQLFYTRKNNPVTLHQIGNATVEKTPSKDSYYYGETITFSGHADEGYTFSGWDIREGEGETGRREGTRIEYTMIATGVEVTPVIREYKYTIHYNASGAVGTIADSVVSYSENVTLPTAEEVAIQYTYTGHHFAGWTTGDVVISTLTKATPVDNGEITLNAKWEENDGVTYSVKHYLEPIAKGRPYEEYELKDTYDGTAPQGTTVTGALNNYPGFEKPAEQGIVLTEDGLVIKYYYTRNSYNYTFNAGEGAKFSSGTTSEVVSFRYEQPVVFTATLIKTGFTQNGWEPALETEMPNENKTTTAEWTENQYTINYNANGGTGETPIQKVRYTEEVALTGNAFIKTGYTFTGWSETAEGSVVYKDKAQVSKLTGVNNATVTLYAQWSADSYTVTFDANSGDVAYLTKKVTYDSTYGTLPIATRTGYDFKGWYTEKVGGEKVTEATKVITAAAHTLYAQWEAKTYTVTFNAEGGEVTIASKEVTYDGEYGELPIPTATGFSFAGWYTGDKIITADTKVTIAADHTLQAHWTENEYTIEFNANGGEGTMPTQRVSYTDEVNLTGNIYTREGYQFIGWSRTENGEKVFNDKQRVTRLASEDNATVILYAVWEKGAYSITYNLNGGSLPAGADNPEAYDVETESFTLENPIRTGYTFEGWSGTGIPTLSTEVTIIQGSTGNRVYEANWKAIEYGIIYNLNDGILSGEQTNPAIYTIETESFTLENPIRTGYTFKGWSGTALTEPTKIVTIAKGSIGAREYEAVWSINRYRITWNNRDGTELEKDENVPYGTMPSYNKADPEKTGDAQYSYTFKGWTPEIKTVTEDQVYTAAYEKTVNKYPITFYDEDGIRVLKATVLYPYGTLSGEIDRPENPSKASDGTYNYEFIGWTPEVATVTTGVDYRATYKSTYIEYLVTFLDSTGAILASGYYHSGATVTIPTAPQKASTAQTGYTFNGWNPEVSVVTGNITYKPTYDETIRSYTITWLNDDDTVIDTTTVEYGVTPTHADASKANTAEYTYTFSGWTPEITSVKGEATYKAIYTSTKNKYTITWKNEDGTVIDTTEVEYGAMPIHADASKANTQEYTYTFSGWTPEITSVEGPATYQAVFTATKNSYAVVFKNEDGTSLQSTEVPYGETPVYNGGTPTSGSTAEYEYTFAGWTPEIKTVTGPAEYTATYTANKRSYTITWKNEDGTVIDTTTVEYGKTPVQPTIPSKTFTEQTGYAFNGWTPGIVAVTGEATYTATYAEYLREYTILWRDRDGNAIATGENIPYGTVIVDNKPGDPSRESTAQTGYVFTGWYDEAGIKLIDTKLLTGDMEYTAKYDEKIRTYTIIWNNRDGTELHRDEKQPYGTHIGYTGPVPTSGSTEQYSYTHKGWMPEVHNVVGPQVYTADYESTIRSYPITFYDEDGTTVIEGPTMYKYGTTSGTYKPTTNPTKEGYSFSKWTPELEPVVGTASYTASYIINSYNITPIKGVGVAEIQGGGSYPYNSTVTLTGIAKEGYHFEGGVSEKAFTYTVPSHDTTLQISAEPNKYYIHFNGNGGVGTMEDQEFTYDEEQSLAPNVYTYNGYYFMSWTDGNGGIYKDNSIVKNLATTGVITLIAQWGDNPGPTPPGPTPGPTPTPSGGGSGGSGGGKRIDKDTEEHASAEVDTGAIEEIEDKEEKNKSEIRTGTHNLPSKSGTTIKSTDDVQIPATRTQEEMDAYKYAYKYGITTLAPKEAARPDEYVQRGHMAKMVVNYALNVLHRKLPEKLPKQCKWKDGRNAWESQEIKEYAEKACVLGLMGIDMEYFQPYKLVTRAQFGTIFGRLLWGKLVSKPYYAEHLARLKKRGIMTQIDRPEERIEVRKWAWLMFMRSEKYFKVKK